MRKRFERGKRLMTIIIATMLLMNGASLWFSRSVLLSWYAETVAHLGQLNALHAQKMLAQIVSVDQRDLLAAQGMSYAFLVLCCIILYLGYSWIRWLWGISWLIQGSSGLFTVTILVTQFGLWTNLVLFGLVTSLLYTVCAACILWSPSIHTYMRMMRR